DAIPARLKTYTSATIDNKAALVAALKEVRDRGYAVNRAEWVEGVWGVAAAIRNNAGAVCASIGIWGPRERITRALDEVAREVRLAADRVSRGLGCPAAFLLQPEETEQT